MKNKAIILILIMIIFSACNSKTELRYYHMGESNGWINENTLTNELAHSGEKSSKVDAEHNFSLGMITTFDKVADKLPRNIHVSCYINCQEEPVSVALICSMGPSMDNHTVYDGYSFENIGMLNEWVKVDYTFLVPANINHTDYVSIYVYSPQGKQLFMDDLKINFEL